MKKFLKIFSIVLVLGLTLFIAACDDGNEEEPEIEIAFTLEEVEVEVGSTVKLVYTVSDEDLELEWSSDKEAVATVNQTGTASGVSAGSANITVKVKDEDVKATIKVIVVEPKVDNTPTSIVLAGDATVVEGESFTIEVVIMPATADKGLDWSSSNEAVATVDNNGKVTGVSFGTAVITAKSSVKASVSATHNVKVVPSGTEEEIVDDAIAYLLGELDEYVTGNFTLPTHPNPDVEVIWRNASSQTVTAYEFTTARDGKDFISVEVTYGTVSKVENVTLLLVIDLENNMHVKLPAAVIELEEFMDDLGTDITENMGLPASLNGVNITWTSSNIEVIKANGDFVRPHNDTNIRLNANVGYAGLSQMLEFNVVGKGYTVEEKVAYISTEGSLKSLHNLTVGGSLSLPTIDNKFGANLIWESDKPAVISNDGVYMDLDLAANEDVTFTVTIVYNVEGFEFEEEVEVKMTVTPLNEIGKAILVYQASEHVVPNHVVFGAAPQLPGQITDLPTVMSEYPDVAITWYGKEGEFDSEMNVIVPKVLYTPTEIYATFSTAGLDDVTLSFPVNIGILSDPDEDFAFTVRTPGYDVSQDQSSGMPAAEGGTGSVYLLGFENFYFKATFARTVGEEQVTKTWYHFFAPGNVKEVTEDMLKDVDGKLFVDKSNVDARIKPQFTSTTRFFRNTTDKTIYIDKDDVVDLGAQMGSEGYKAFVLDENGKVVVKATPGMAFAPEGFTAYEIPAGGLFVAPGYLESGVNINLWFFGEEEDRVIEILPLTDWKSYTVPAPAE